MNSPSCRYLLPTLGVATRRKPCQFLQLSVSSLRIVAVLCAILVFGTPVVGVQGAETKRVLIVHSFGSAAPPFTTHSSAFETTLTGEIGERVDLDEISLDMARYADLDMQEALVDYMERRGANWRPDLIVPIGSPAGIFVAQYRERLFSKTPILYCGMDRRRLPGGALDANATFIGENFDLPGFVEDILQIAPATTNIAIVIGASPLEQFWATAVQAAFAPYTNRVQLTWLNELPFDQMLNRVSTLPPRSFVFMILLLRDAAGVTINADEALKRMREVANAPINGIFLHQLGMGLVGGRLYDAEAQGVEAARIAVRILRGEPISSFPPRIIERLSPRYDWRELRRWRIDEKLLPANSTILFRTPTAWEQYRWWVIGGLSVGALQAALIFGLLVNLIKRRRVERSLGESEARFLAAADAAPLMIWMSGLEKGCTFFNKAWTAFTGRTLEEEKGCGWTAGVHPDDLPRCHKVFGEAFEMRQPFVMEYRLRRHDQEYRWVSDVGRPRQDSEGNFAGYVGSCVDITEVRSMTEALVESQNRLHSILQTAIEGIITVNNRGIVESANGSAETIFRRAASEMVGEHVNRLMVTPAGAGRWMDFISYVRRHCNEKARSAQKARGRNKDGSYFPIELAITEITLADRQIFAVFVRDATDHEQANRTALDLSSRLIAAQEMERSRLARELHDDITQRLARLAIDAGRVEIAAPGAGQHETIREVREGLVRLSEDVHSLSYKLHPSLLEDLGLVEAIRAESERFEKHESISVTLKLEPLSPDVSPDTGLCLFRVTQEALRNVARHARARAASVSLRSLDGGLQLAVSDTGIGFDPDQNRHRHSLGLASMRERVRLLGGELEIESAPGQGTSIVVWAPLCPETA